MKIPDSVATHKAKLNAWQYFWVIKYMPKPSEMSKDERKLYRVLTDSEKEELRRARDES